MVVSGRFSLFDFRSHVCLSSSSDAPFRVLHRDWVPAKAFRSAASKKGAVQHGKPAGIAGWDEAGVTRIDAVVVGAVAVSSRSGLRLGKGKGAAELEWGLLTEMGLVDPAETLVLTMVHGAQIVNGMDAHQDELLAPHDLPVDVVVTPRRTFRVREPLEKPAFGIDWERLKGEDLEAMPVLKEWRKMNAK